MSNIHRTPNGGGYSTVDPVVEELTLVASLHLKMSLCF